MAFHPRARLLIGRLHKLKKGRSQPRRTPTDPIFTLLALQLNTFEVAPPPTVPIPWR